MTFLRVLAKVVVFPLILLLGLASAFTKVSVRLGCYVGGFIINLFIICAVINLLAHNIPIAAVCGAFILGIIGILFFATNIELLCDDLRDALKQI